MKVFGVALSFVLGSFLYAQTADASCGVLEVSKGDVKIENGQTKQAQAAAQGAKICSGDTIIAAKDSRAKIKMEDGNELNISPDSKIVLENYQYNPAENKKKVLLNVLQGKVRAATKQENMYNDKSRDGANNSFQVKTKSAVAGVRGTDFLTGFDPKTNKSEIVTFKGSVEFGKPGPGGTIQNAVQVGAGQKTEALPGQPPAPPKAVPARELQQMNTETKADTGGAGPGAGPSAGTGGEKKSDKKEDGAAADGDKKVANEPKPDDKKAESGEKKPSESQQGDKRAESGRTDDKKAEPSGKQAGGEGPKGDRGPANDNPKPDGPAPKSDGPKPEGPKPTFVGGGPGGPGGPSGPDIAKPPEMMRPPAFIPPPVQFLPPVIPSLPSQVNDSIQNLPTRLKITITPK